MQPIADIRKDYKLHSFDESDALPNPFDQFGKWWQEAITSQIDEVNAMTLATVTADGRPDARIVLLKNFTENGFTFFTNYESRKGQELTLHPYASLVFFWKELERQIRIEGTVTKIEDAESDIYFQSRPVASQIGAWASPQSFVIENRAVLEQKVEEVKKMYAEANIPRPPHWGGYLVKPTQIEFWQGRRSRLHDRIRYQLFEGDIWQRERLAP